MVGLEEPDLAENMIELEAVRQSAEALAQDLDLTVHALEQLFGGRPSPRHQNTYDFLESNIP
jgi:hypothetical protein